MKKNSCTQINPKKYSCHGLKNIHTRNVITEKYSCGSKIPHPSRNFSNSLNQVWLFNDKTVRVPLSLIKLPGTVWTATARNSYLSLTNIEHHVEGVRREDFFSKHVPTSLLNILLPSLGVPVLFQHFDLRSTNPSRDARLDVKAGWFWTRGRGVTVFFLCTSDAR